MKRKRKILSQRTLARALGRPAHRFNVALPVIRSFTFQFSFIPKKKQQPGCFRLRKKSVKKNGEGSVKKSKSDFPMFFRFLQKD
jgi:hypothetical protein